MTSRRLVGLAIGLVGLAAAPAEPDGPPETPGSLRVADDLAVDRVLAEPLVRQPLAISFDERGRMWVVQYLQYPDPADLKEVSRDQFWRVVYDKVPAPPPNHVRGADKITIHEDTDGDGAFDTHSTFVDGLNIATSVAQGRGGAFVLNPPYLLFYPRAGGADAPTGDPEVLLEGFGLEDTHSVVNSLRWGPDGWLYAAQGSTVTGNVRRPNSNDPPIRSAGQLIWRYHPETRRYEVFAEGGGNAFGVEFDARGHVYSGHNGGNTRGFHYVQGGYYHKGFDKHGPLSNPHAYGFFEAMRHDDVPRFTHTFALADGCALPDRHRGHLFAANPLEGRIIEAEMTADGSTRKTRDLGPAIASVDPTFRPVDLKFGPDGALYVADWRDAHVSHLQNHAGQLDRETGRIERIRARDARPIAPFDLGRETTPQLVDRLRSPNKWFRQTALQILGDRKDPIALPLLRAMLDREAGQAALEALWGLNLSGGFDDEATLAALGHREPAVREWAIRLAGDDGEASPALAAKLAELAAVEPIVEVRSQLACTALRLPTAAALPIVRRLMARDEDAGDPHLPLLLWWAIEAKVGTDPDAVLDLFAGSGVIATQTLAPRLIRRFASRGTPADIQACLALFRRAPNPAAGRALLAGFEAGLEGRSVAELPIELLEATAKLGGGSIALGIRLGRPEALAGAAALVVDPKAAAKRRLEGIEALGESGRPEGRPPLLAVALGPGPAGLRSAALTALRKHDDPAVAAALIDAWPDLPNDVRPAALGLLAGRRGWARQLAEAAASGRIDKATVPPDAVRRLAGISDPDVAEAVRAAWGEVAGATSTAMQREIGRVAAALEVGGGDPIAGKRTFAAKCASCHRLFGEGGDVGPDLTPFRRDDIPTLLLSLINPSAEIREGFEEHVVETVDGLTAIGVLAEQGPARLILRSADGSRIAIDRAEVERMAVSGRSVMPEGLLAGMSDRDLIDLFGYLRTSQPQPTRR